MAYNHYVDEYGRVVSNQYPPEFNHVIYGEGAPGAHVSFEQSVDPHDQPQFMPNLAPPQDQRMSLLGAVSFQGQNHTINNHIPGFQPPTNAWQVDPHSGTAVNFPVDMPWPEQRPQHWSMQEAAAAQTLITPRNSGDAAMQHVQEEGYQVPANVLWRNASIPEHAQHLEQQHVASENQPKQAGGDRIIPEIANENRGHDTAKAVSKASDKSESSTKAPVKPPLKSALKSSGNKGKKGPQSKAEVSFEERRENYLKRNRDAATKCRTKKKQQNKQMAERLKWLQAHNKCLIQEREASISVRNRLQDSMLEHVDRPECRCENLHRYIREQSKLVRPVLPVNEDFGGVQNLASERLSYENFSKRSRRSMPESFEDENEDEDEQSDDSDEQQEAGDSENEADGEQMQE